VPKRRALSLLLLGLAAQVAACATMPRVREPELLVFWRVSRADGSGGSAHLLGSMHVAKQALALDPAIETALADADAIALEVAPAELDPKAMVDLVVSLGQLPPGESLAQLVSANTMRRLEKRVAGSQVPLSIWTRWEPWLVTMMLANDQLATEGFSAAAGVEPHIGARAAEAQKPTRGLETAREQIERFDTLPLATQELLLRDALIEKKHWREHDTLESAWRRGDLEALARQVFASPRGKGAAAFFEAIYFARNRAFADDIARLIDAGGRWFVALGAGHMVGDEGIPQLLAARGYRVERVPKTVVSTAAVDAEASARREPTIPQEPKP